MKNNFKVGDLVEYKYARGFNYRTFGLIEGVREDRIAVQWLWTENLKGELPKSMQPRENSPAQHFKNKHGLFYELTLVS